MEIRLRENGAVISDQQFRAMYPNVTFSSVLTHEVLNDFGADPVLPSPPPMAQPNQIPIRNGATQDVNGNWVWAWALQAIPQAQLDASLAAAKTAKNTQINQWREQANGSTFPYGGKHIACDRLSKDDIMGTALHALLFNAFPDDFPGAWKATDNSYLPMPDIATFKAMFSAMTNQGSLNFAYSQQLKTQLANAATLAAVNEIVW